MKMNKILRGGLVLCMALLLCAACGKKTRISSLLFNKDITRAYLDEQAFTGKAWSEDGKTVCLECENGAVKLVTVYHANGNVALQNTSLAGAGESFDIDGNPISMNDFVLKYPRVVVEVQNMINNMLYTDELE